MIDEAIIWETLLVQVRGVLIRQASIAKRNRCTKEENLLNKIDDLEQKSNSNIENASLMEEIEKHHAELVKIREDGLKGSKIRSRAQWVENGEKPSKFFLQLEKSNYINKSIKELAVDENTTITDQTLIIDEIRNFYKDLYSNKLSTRDLKESLKKLDTSGLKKIPDEMSEALNEQISFKEPSDAVFSSKNHKSPDPDGFFD